MYAISVLFELFLLVMCIQVDLQVLKIWDLGSILNVVRLDLAKPSQQGEKTTRASLANVSCRRVWHISLLKE